MSYQVSKILLYRFELGKVRIIAEMPFYYDKFYIDFNFIS